MKLKVGKLVAFAATGMKPESTPVLPFARVSIVHGSAKVDWVTVWFFGKKTNLGDVRSNLN